MIKRLFAFLGMLAVLSFAHPVSTGKKGEKLYKPHVIKGAGLSIDFYTPWKVESYIEDKGGNVIQRIDGDKGLVFVRYGKNYYDQEETVDNFLSWLVSAHTTYTVKKDEKIKFRGKSARRVLVFQEKQAVHVRFKNEDGVSVCKDEPATTTRFLVIGFLNNDTPVLVGYRILSDHFTKHRAVLKKIIKSVVLEKDKKE